jgi:hypothetical protein
MMTLNELTPEHLGEIATLEDVEQFRDWARELMARDGLNESDAIETLWGGGDYYARAIDLGLRPEVGPLE